MANENDSVVTLNIRMLNGAISEKRSILVRVTTADDTAQGKCNPLNLCPSISHQMFFNISAPVDYQDLSQILTFSNSSMEQTIMVTINDDNLFEDNEVFRATLELVDVDADLEGVLLLPAEASVTIFDEDGEYIIPHTFYLEP